MAEPIPQTTSTDMKYKYINTTAAYDQWASVYDTDGNFLQALDTIEMRALFPTFLDELDKAFPTSSEGSTSRKDGPSSGEEPTPPLRNPARRKIVDLGCGTGRNTTALLPLLNTEIIALDASPGMLDVARKRIQAIQSTLYNSVPGPDSSPPSNSTSSLTSAVVYFEVFDLISSPTPPPSSLSAHAIISTLVIEHIPTHTFFAQASAILRPGGILLITNMHSDMGAISQAGFIDPVTGEKVRPVSYAHTVEEVVRTAEECGLDVVGGVKETMVEESMVERLGRRSGKWVGVTVWFGGLFRKRA